MTVGGLYGIELAASCTHCTVNRNTLEGAAILGISVTTTASAIVINGNEIARTGTHGIQIHDRCTDIVIAENEITDAGGNGVYINGANGSTPVARWAITNNSIRGCGYAGIYVLNSQDGVVINNILSQTNRASAANFSEITLNIASNGASSHITLSGNRGTVTRVQSQLASLSQRPAFRWLPGAPVATTTTAVAHGLNHKPERVLVLEPKASSVWQTAEADDTHIYLRASEPAVADVYVS
jgi:parallel beta-helix repeat protein